MRGSIGQILIQQGVIDASGLADALARQSGRHPVASELYALGYASERQLCVALSAQTGWPAVVLDESMIRLDILEHVSLEWSRIFHALLVHEDSTTIVIAAARPEDAIVPARELGAARNKTVELRIALDITLARTIRVAFRMWKQGDRYLAGSESDRTTPKLAIVHPDGGEDEHRRAQRALAEDAARNIESQDDMPNELSGASMSLTSDWNASTITTSDDDDRVVADPEQRTLEIAAEIDRHAPIGGQPPHRDSATDPSGRELDEPATDPSARTDREKTGELQDLDVNAPHALIVDPDPANRIQMVAELERLGYRCQAAPSGTQAIELLAGIAFDVVFTDVATSEIDGLVMCRAIKLSQRLQKTRVVVTTSVVDSGQVADEVLQRAGADGYLEKPLDIRRLHRLLRELSSERVDHEVLLADALARYHAGDIEGAIARLRGALVTDPSSPKLHFMLANMLQRASRYLEAVDEYEAVVELQPVYFPALTRLAYLYFRQGLHARAVETWRRALPVCEDPVLRKNIELFMRKLVADMAKSDSV